jgi:ubiquinone/menaquinone biosynthesis C-methylase UbiE
MTSTQANANFTLKEEIRAYWSMRAETFDLQVGHSIQSDRELEAFRALMRSAFGTEPRDVLDLACGTGEITRAALTLGHRVTGIDFAEPMIARARAKHQGRARIMMCDAEHLLFEDASFDGAVTRHLVWTLTDPEKAFSEWFRVLRPGGRLLVLDGDFINRTWMQKAMLAAADRLRRLVGAPEAKQPDRETFNSIASRFYFKDGLTRDRLADLLTQAGFSRIETADYRPILRAQEALLPFHEALKRRASTRFALIAHR